MNNPKFGEIRVATKDFILTFMKFDGGAPQIDVRKGEKVVCLGMHNIKTKRHTLTNVLTENGILYVATTSELMACTKAL